MLREMTIAEKLRALRTERGATLDAVAMDTGISRAALSSYETNEYKDISHVAIAALAKYYGVSSDFLLGLSQHKRSRNVALDELNLDDNMLRLLKSGKLNTRLLCEMAAHEGFERLMLDIEIDVDRIASMRIKDLNVMMESTRMLLAEKGEDEKNALNLRALELASVKEDETFAHVVSEDLMTIIRDIREAHKSDITMADEPSGSAIFLQRLNDYMNMRGTPEEKKIRLLCMQLGINYDKLTPEEVVTLLSVLHKSNLTTRHGRMRGRTGKGKK